MKSVCSAVRRLTGDSRGNIAISTALVMPLILFSLGLGVDYSALTFQKRNAQDTADLAAIVAAGNLDKAPQNIANHMKNNGLNLLVRIPQGLLAPDGTLLADTSLNVGKYDGVVTIDKGRYVADPSVAVGQRFTAAAPYDAVRVNIEESGDLYFASVFGKAPTLKVSGTAAATKYAAFSIGSRVASLDGGLVNAVLGGLLGTKLSVSLVDYQALASANVNVLQFLKALALNLNLQALTYDDLLKTEITYGQFLDALGKTTGLTARVTGIVKNLNTTLGKTKLTLMAGEFIGLAPIASKLVGSDDNLSVTANVFDLVKAAAVAADGGKQIGVDLAGTIPGLTSVKLNIAIGEPPLETPPLAVGAIGSVIRTAQTRLTLEISLNGLLSLLGLTVRVPIYAEVGHAEAKLVDIRCLGGSLTNANVSIDAVPGVAELAIGNVDTTAFANFSATPRVTQATLVDALLVKIRASSDVNITNMTKTRLTFTPAEIAAGTPKTVSTSDVLTSTITSLLGNLNAEIQILFITIGTQQQVQQALANTLSTLTAPLDTILYNTLLMLGVRIGEVDVWATDVRCQQSVLVQ